MLRWEWGVRLCARVGCVRGCGAQGAVKAARHPFFREKKSEAREGGEGGKAAAISLMASISRGTMAW